MRKLIITAIMVGQMAAGVALAAAKPAPKLELSRTHQFVPVWSAQSGRGAGTDFLRLSPALDPTTLFSADVSGHVFAFARENGQLRWQTRVHDEVTSGLEVFDGHLLLGTREGIVRVLDANSGAEKWRRSVSSEVLAPPTAAEGVVVAQAADGEVFGLNADTGVQLWNYRSSLPALTLRGHSRAVIAKGRVLAGFANGKVVALSLHEGKLLWEYTLAQPKGRTELERMVDIDADPLALGDVLYSVSYQGRIVALDIASGRLLWSRDASSYSGMTADDRYLYLADSEGNIQAYDRTDGATLWKQIKLAGRKLSAPVVVGKAVVLGDDRGNLYALNREDGSLINKIGLSELVNRTRGKASDLWTDYENQSLRWRVAQNVAIRAPLLTMNDTVVAVASDGSLIAFRVLPAEERK